MKFNTLHSIPKIELGGYIVAKKAAHLTFEESLSPDKGICHIL